MRFRFLIGCLTTVTVLAIGLKTSAQALPDCTIDFEAPVCPDAGAVCGATFTGGDGCLVEGIPNCYSSGLFSYKITPAAPLTITLSGDLPSLELFFAHQGPGVSGMMRFFDAAVGGNEVGPPLTTNGECPATMPPLQVLAFTTAVRRIEVTATGGTAWIDDFRVTPCRDCDNDGFDSAIVGGTDCDDTDPTINPGAAEVCDGIDNNCNGQIDEGAALDMDGDGFTLCGGDCNDSDAGINPDAAEICDGRDNNCDAVIDEGFDQDGDGFTLCGGDCNDTDAGINPDAAEVCDGRDNNCDSAIDEGFDRDGDGTADCNDQCPDDPAKLTPGGCGCGQPDTDTNGDGVSDCLQQPEQQEGPSPKLEFCVLLSLILRLPVCGVGCPFALLATLVMLGGMKASRRRP